MGNQYCNCTNSLSDPIDEDLEINNGIITGRPYYDDEIPIEPPNMKPFPSHQLLQRESFNNDITVDQTLDLSQNELKGELMMLVHSDGTFVERFLNLSHEGLSLFKSIFSMTYSKRPMQNLNLDQITDINMKHFKKYPKFRVIIDYNIQPTAAKKRRIKSYPVTPKPLKKAYLILGTNNLQQAQLVFYNLLVYKKRIQIQLK